MSKKDVKMGTTFNCMVSLHIIAASGFMIPTYCELDFIFCLLSTGSQDTQGKSRLKLFLYTSMRAIAAITPYDV